MDKTVTIVRTKLDKNDKSPKVTSVGLIWDGVTVDMLKGVATDGLVINLQGKFRRAKSIPPVYEARVVDLIAGMGSRQIPATVEGLSAVAKGMKPEEIEALIAKLREESKEREKVEKAASAPKGNAPRAAKSKNDGGQPAA